MNPVSTLLFFVIGGLASLLYELGALGAQGAGLAELLLGAGVLSAFIAASSPRTADQWERAVVLRLGRYVGLRGPGLFWVLPGFDSVNMIIDSRIRTTTFMAEKTLTKDTVPVDVDAVLFWQVFDAEAAALEVEDYQAAVTWSAQTALRDLIGKTDLADMLRGREHMDAELQKIIDERTHAWGIAVRSVEIRDVVIPKSLEDAMSRQAQAERERLARVILGEAEEMIADSFVRAADRYKGHEAAFHLRALNILYEGLKEKGNVMVVPSTAVETLGAGGMAGMLALKQQLSSQHELENGKRPSVEAQDSTQRLPGTSAQALAIGDGASLARAAETIAASRDATEE